jgi:Tol biopolymer transport system component
MRNIDPLLVLFILTQLITAQTPAAPQRQSTAPRLTQAQAPDIGTDIWLARLTASGLEQPLNITARPGYDNQPAFTPDGKAILFTRRDGDQTDIFLYDFTSRSSAATPVTRTPESEYSPTVTPDGEGISVIRVEADASQRLWRFDRKGQNPTVILPDVKPVGYHAWAPDGLLALFVLGDPNTLQVANRRTGRSHIVAERIGRSIHRIPGRHTISVLHTESGGRTIKELDTKTRRLTPIVRAIDSTEGDYAWTPDGAILMSDGKRLMRWTQGTEWTECADLATLGLAGASRLAVSPDGKWLAMVVPDGR